MKRRTFVKLAGASAFAGAVSAPAIAQGVTTVRWWYHYDNPQNTPAALIAKFEQANPGIKIQAEAIPWGGGTDYINRMFSSVVAGNQPDCAMVRLAYLSRFGQMRALEPLDGYLTKWAERSDISDDVWKLNRAPDGKQYYMPLHYVVIYLYYRQDLFQQAGLQPPKTFDEFLNCAKTLTKDGMYGYGMRGGGGCHDNWGPFVLGGGASFDKGGMLTDKALAANRFFVEFATKHKVVPPSAPTDAFRQIVDAFKAGRTAMTIHHIGSAAEMVGALGDKASAVPLPRGPGGGGWTYFGDESNAIFASSKVKEAAFKWVSFLSSGDGNVEQAKLSGQLPITTSGLKNWTGHPKRFVEASFASLPIAQTLPDNVKTPDFVGRVLPTNLQRALLGETNPDEVMKAVEQLFHG
ncbi:MAG: extracellular solute-binding protein [Alphaproteobacteria bacterium]|nr:extracellular solute-binding protein [Alphaproteobacteria bacterium]